MHNLILGERTPCADDPDMMFDPERAVEAQALCAGCPVRLHCAALGAGELDGTWGGIPAPNLLAEIAEVRHDEIAQAVREGGSQRGVARQFGITPGYVRAIAREIGQAA